MNEKLKNVFINLCGVWSSRELKKKIVTLESKNKTLETSSLELSHKNDELEKKLLEFNKLFSLISHDLSGSFNVFLGLTELLASRHETMAATKKLAYINALHDQANSVFVLLTNLLDWSRSQIGARQVILTKLNLKKTVDSVINLLRTNNPEKVVSLVNEIRDNVIVSADANIVEAVLRNLISNALKFTNTGGTISITEITTNGIVSVSVTDTGVGIKPDNLKKLFGAELFSTAGTCHEKGTGLGLLLCREMIEKQGGDIYAKSVIGKGTIMTFTLKDGTKK